MKIHKEGRSFLLMLFLALIVINGLIYLIFNSVILTTTTIVVSLGFFSFFTYFFRISERTHIADDNYIVAPADGKIVVIEPTEENGLQGDPSSESASARRILGKNSAARIRTDLRMHHSARFGQPLRGNDPRSRRGCA